MTQAEYDHLRGLVLRHDAELSDLKGVVAMVRKVVDQVNRIDGIVIKLEDFAADTKVRHIRTLQNENQLLKDREEEIRNEAKRDQLDRRRSARAAIVSILSTLAAAYIAAKLGLRLVP